MAGRLLGLEVQEVAAERDPATLAAPAAVNQLVLQRQHLTDDLDGPGRLFYPVAAKVQVSDGDT
jgi:hypothetical protein